MIGCEKVKGRLPWEGDAWTVSYITAKRHGTRRFGSRAEATTFAVEILQELLDNPPG